ncbi:MAG: S9 family peptidase [Bacteroidetes bacterium]|nr:MAG: S9 family peptidase [Bacteroidota bacterium]
MKKLNVLLILMMMTIAGSFAQKQAMVPETLWEFGRVGGMQVSPDGTTLLFTITHFDVEANKSTRDIYTMPVSGGRERNITSSNYNEFNAIWRPDGRRIGFLSNQSGNVQMWEMEVDGTHARQVSNISGGISGFEYSPDMKHIFFTKRVQIEESPLDKHPDLPKTNVYIYDDLMYRHWDKWHDYSYSHIFVAPYNDGTTGRYYDIMEGEPYDSPMPPFGGVGQISWTPDGKAIAYTSKKLTGKERAKSTNSNIYLYNLETRETRNLTPFNQGYDKNPVFSPDGRYMAWESMETPGFEADKTRIMIMDMSDGSYSYYSEGFDQSAGNLRWSKDGRSLYFISGHNATYQMYQLTIANREIKQITDGWHNYNSLALAGDYLVGERMSMSSPVEIFRVNKNDGTQTQLTNVNASVFEKTEMGRVEQRWIETTDGKEMLVWVIYPPNFDETKKYPALLYCGGGPQSAVSQFFSYRWNFQIMAAHDYIIIAPNRRGLPTFGQEWNDQISQDYGGQNMQDLLTAAREVSKEPFIDETRLGAVGASYGGFSVFWLAGNHDGLFSAFISHCGMFNFESWYGTTEEMFFANHDIGGPYWAEPRPRSYDFSPHLFVANWDTPIMVIHGAKDYRVPKSEGLQAYNVAQLMGIPSRLMIFPEENHWVLTPQNSILWQREFFKWLDQWLK